MLVYIYAYCNRFVNDIQISFFGSIMTNYAVIIIS